MASRVYEAAQRQEADDTITSIHEEPETIDDCPDENLKIYNLLSLGYLILFTHTSHHTDHMCCQMVAVSAVIGAFWL